MCLFLSPALLPAHLDTLYTTYIHTGIAIGAPKEGSGFPPTSSKTDYDLRFNRIVGAATPEDFYHLQHLAFQNSQVDLHTSPHFGTIGSSRLQETVVRRAWSQRFLKQLATIGSVLDLWVGDYDEAEYADIFFTTWMNTAPAVVSPGRGLDRSPISTGVTFADSEFPCCSAGSRSSRPP